MQPINYSMDIQDPSQAFLSAFQTGSAITQSRLAQEQAVRQAEQQQRMTAAFDRLRQPGATAKDYADLAMQLPETQAKAVRESFSMISQEQQQNALMNSGKVFAAFKSGQPEIAINLMEQQIAAKRNSGDEEGAKFLETWRDVTRENPQSTEDYFGFTLSQMPGGDKIIESAVKFGAERRTEALQPAALQKAQAEATQAEQKALNAVATARDDIAKSEAEAQLAIAQADKAKVEARIAEATKLSVISEAASKAASAKVTAEFAGRSALVALNLNEAQIANYASQQDIAKQNQRIAAMQADAAKVDNELKRRELELKINTAQETRDQSVRDKYSQAQNVLATFDSTLVSVDKILNNWGKTKDGKIDPNLSNATVKSATGPVQSRIFTVGQDTADFEEQVASLESQAFLSQVEKMRGLGALTEREGARLVNALASLSLRQSPKQLAENLLVVRELMEKARSSAEAKYGDLEAPPTTPPASPAATPATPGMLPGFRVIR